jgi:ATP-binding cassette subfamily C protein CydCD
VLRGAIVPSSGAVELGGVPIVDLPLAERSAAIRWCGQHPQPIGGDVASSAALGHGAGPAVDAAVGAALEQVGIAHLAAAPPAAISGGERRRVAIARALVGVHLGTARFLLFDEPTAQLDAGSADHVIAALRWSADRGVGVLVATHDAPLAAAADEQVAVRVDLDADALPAEPAADVEAPALLTVDPLPVGRHDPEAPLPERFIATRARGHDEAAAPDPSGAQAVRWLLRTARPQRARLLGSQVLGVLTEVCAVGLTATAAWLVVEASHEPDWAKLTLAAVGVRAFALSKGALRYAERLASHDATLRLLAELRATVVERLTWLAPTGLPDGGRGELLTRVVDDIDRLQDLFLRVVGPLVSTLVVAVGAAAFLGIIDPPAGAALLAAVLVAGVALPLATHRSAVTDGAELAHRRGVVAATTVDLAEHVDELVACSAEGDWRERIERDAASADEVDGRLARISTVVAAAGAARPALACAAVVAVAGTAGPTTGLTGPQLGVLVLLPLAVMELLVPLSAAGTVLARVQASAVRVLALLRRPDPVVEPDRPVPPPAEGDLALVGAAVGWPGHDAQVSGIDLALAPGERARILGPSGSGKSTIAATLVAFLAPVEGEYRIGGVASDELGGDHVRQVVTWCQQEPWFADTSVAENLRIARPAATDDELRDALAVAHLSSWLDGLPDGLDTRLERDASTISGGERQRLALARALLGDRTAIVLDEPTAHLDAPTGAGVVRDLLDATRDRAVILIGHGLDEHAVGDDPDRRARPEDTYVLARAVDGSVRWSTVTASPGAALGSAQG